MLVYLSGPMTAVGPPTYNYPAFNEAARVLRGLGFDVINPAETAGGITHLPKETFMQIDLGYVQAVDAVVVLPRWWRSKGAILETLTCEALGRPVYQYNPGTGLGHRVDLAPVMTFDVMEEYSPERENEDD